jgi:hypothetical protein
MIKKEAAQSAFRMLDSFILIGLTRNNGLDQHAYSDNMPIRYDFEASFEVNYKKREGWNHVSTEQSILTYYTDGSRKDGTIGIGIFGPSVTYYYEALSASITIFQAE